MSPPSWRDIRALTRLRRRQAATVRHGPPEPKSVRRYRRWLEAGAPYPTTVIGIQATERVAMLWDFQRGRCYICRHGFCEKRPPTREHVKPRSRGGKFILLACRPCNELKANRPPTVREINLTMAFIDRDIDRWHALMLTVDPVTPGA